MNRDMPVIPRHEEWAALQKTPGRWLVTGAAGFIGSHLAEHLLRSGQSVTGLDDLSSGSSGNLDLVMRAVPPDCRDRFDFIEGDIRDADACMKACRGADYILHQAAIGSVPKSFEDPALVESVNVGGLLTLLAAAAACGVGRFVYASSSAVYGDRTTAPNREDQPVAPQSPYAVGKHAGEVYAALLGRQYGIATVGLRYFNVYGTRQDPNGAYAAVIPKWIDALSHGRPVEIYGDGGAVRDFCHVEDVVQANIRAATTRHPDLAGAVYNVGSGAATSLNDLFALLSGMLAPGAAPVYAPGRTGDIRISRADIGRAMRDLGYAPAISFADGLAKTAGATARMQAGGSA